MAAGWNKGISIKDYCCKYCGETDSSKFFQKNKMKSCCAKCHTLHVHQKKREIKLRGIEYLGGHCHRCGYQGVPAVYDFHHKDQNQKEFSWGGKRTNWENLKKELDKCQLLCANCHREIHDAEWFDQLPDHHPEKVRRLGERAGR